MQCPYCHQQHPQNASFCPVTGKALAQIHNCPNCGETIETDWIACGYCGFKLKPQDDLQVRQMGSTKSSSSILPRWVSWVGGLSFILILVVIAVGLIISSKNQQSQAKEPLTNSDQINIPNDGAILPNESQTAPLDQFEETEYIGIQTPSSDLLSEDNILNKPTSNNINDGEQAFIGPWQIAYLGTKELTDYAEKLPEGGHKFHQINLQILNTSNTPALFTPNSLGFFSAEWEDYEYRAINTEALSGYIPPGWPVSINVIFDLPEIVVSPKFVLHPINIGQGKSEPIVLNLLGSGFNYEYPPLLKMGDEFIVEDVLSITPLELRSIIDDEYRNANHFLLLDSEVSNLYGHDINPEDEPIILQIFADGLIMTDHDQVWGDIMPFINFHHVGNSWFQNRSEWVPDDVDTKQIAPGFTKSGSFLLNNWWPTIPEGGMVLLIMLDKDRGFQFTPTDWALYQLNSSAIELLKMPIAPIDTAEIALEKAETAIEEEDWVIASIMLGYSQRKHPGNQLIEDKLHNALPNAGELIFQDRRSGFLMQREIGALDEDAGIFLEIESDVYQNNALSPDGNYFAYPRLDQDGIHVVNIGTGDEIILNPPDSLNLPYKIRGIDFMTMSASGNELFVIYDTYGGTNEIARFNLETREFHMFEFCGVEGNEDRIALSADGGSIAGIDGGQVYVAKADGSGCRVVAEGLSDEAEKGPIVWSPDGNSLYFTNNEMVTRINVDSADYENLTPRLPSQNGIKNLVFSPDGRYLAVLLNPFDYNLYIYDTLTGEIYQDPKSEIGPLLGWIKH